MHIYLYLKSFMSNPHQRDGITKAVHGLAMGLARCGLSVTVLSEGPQVAWCDTDYGYAHRCFLHETTSPSRRISVALQSFVDQFVKPQDLVILNGGFHLSVYAFSRFLKRQGLRYIFAPHLNYDLQMFRKKPWLKYPYWYLFEKPMLNDALAIQMLDRRQACGLRDRGITPPILEVQNGFEFTDQISLDAFPLSQPRSNQSPHLFFLGRLSIHTKGLDLLLDALAGLIAHLKRSGADNATLDEAIDEAISDNAILPTLSLQGSDVGDNAQLRQQIQRLHLEEQVTLLEGDYQTPPPLLMAAHDIVCLPSRSEGFGLVALEAMLAGRVLLVPAHSGIAPHVVASGCGVAVMPTVDSIQAGLQWLLRRRSNWPKMGLQGREYALRNFQWESIAAKAINDYQALIPGYSHPSPRVVLQRGISDWNDRTQDYRGERDADWGAQGNERSRISSGVKSK